MKKYRVGRFSKTIEQVEVERETAHYVWIDGCRSAKRHELGGYFDTFAAAKTFLMDIATKRLASARRQADQAQEFMDHVRDLKE